MSKDDDILNDKQKMFCHEYIVDMNGQAAAIRAGYTPKTAMVQASRLLTYAKVQREVARLIVERQNRVKVDADTVLKALLQIATSDISEVFDEANQLKNLKDIPEHVRKAISSVEVEKIGYDEEFKYVTKVKFWDKNKALESLGRHLKLFTDKIEVSDSVDRAKKIKEARERAIKK